LADHGHHRDDQPEPLLPELLRDRDEGCNRRENAEARPLHQSYRRSGCDARVPRHQGEDQKKRNDPEQAVEVLGVDRAVVESA
jgi:hypothetical protein